MFTAVLDNVELSRLSARKGGICNLVNTDEDSEGCGLATTLMEYCFTDDKVGGIDVQKNKDFKKEHFRECREMAMKKCEHIVYLKCATKKTYACSAYFTAAINTKHTLMFTTTDDDDIGTPLQANVFDVAESQLEFKEDADGWIKTYGNDWYFCKCKTQKCTIL